MIRGGVKRARTAVLWAGACAALSAAAGAQEPSAPAAPQAEAAAPAREGVEVFAPAFFETYNPVTALDMVRRIPGFSIDGGAGNNNGGGGGFDFGGGQRRGFAANATNVLINSERPSTKTGIENQLDRISAANVARLELIRGAGLADMDVRGQTQIVNVVLLPGVSLGATTTYIAELRFVSEAERIGHELQFSRAQRLLGGDLTMNLRLPSDQEYGHQTETVRDVNADVIEVRREFNQRDRYPFELSGTGTWTPTASDTINLNAEYTTWYHQQDFFSDVFDGDDQRVGAEVRVTEETDTYTATAGGDWEHQLNDTVSAKLLGLLTQRDQVNTTDEQIYTTAAGFDNGSVLASGNGSGERIARGTVTWRATDAHTIELGLETAFNFLDSAFTLEPVDQNGVPTGAFRVADDTRVEELRGEASVSDVWTVSPRLTLEAGFVFEASRISQIRDDGEPFERELTFPKPRFTGTWSREGGNQFRLVIERDVGQLNFQDFATQVNLGDNRTESGNPDLEPEQAWKSSLQWEQRFGSRGALTLEGFYDSYEDKQDRVPIFLTGVPYPLDGSGNLGDATKYGVRVDATIPLEFMWVPNGELRLRGARSISEVEDGVTGETRLFSGDNEWFYSVDFRQDVSAWDLAWGAGYNRDGIRNQFRATEIHRFGNVDGFLTAFVETTKIPGVTVRLQVQNANDSEFYRLRSMWRTVEPDGEVVERARDLNPPDFTETRNRQMSPVYSIRLSGAF